MRRWRAAVGHPTRRRLGHDRPVRTGVIDTHCDKSSARVWSIHMRRPSAANCRGVDALSRDSIGEVISEYFVNGLSQDYASYVQCATVSM